MSRSESRSVIPYWEVRTVHLAPNLNLLYAFVMPTVLKIGPFRFHFYSNEKGEPPHIHVDYEDSDAKFWLDPVVLAKNKGIPPHKLREIERLVRSHKTFLEEKYNEFHSC